MSIRTDLAALALVALVAGCLAPQASSPTRKPGPSGLPLSPSPTVTSPKGLATIEACDLLTTQEASSLGMRPQGRAEKITELRRCDWTTPGGGGVSTSINEHRGISELNFADATNIADIRIGRYEAKRVLENSGPGYCQIVFPVGDTANVSVLALYMRDTARACAVADRAAVLVESKLP